MADADLVIKLTIILFTTVPAFSKGIDTTEIVIIGTIHNKTEEFNEQKLQVHLT